MYISMYSVHIYNIYSNQYFAVKLEIKFIQFKSILKVKVDLMLLLEV